MKKNLDLKPYGKYLEGISQKHGRAKVFDDFLQIIVCCLSMGRKEELYFKTIKPYSKEELNLFSEAFASLVIQINEHPLQDPFGDYFEEHLSDARNGQFFTPFSVSDLMAELLTARQPENRRKDGDTRVYDPTCGSGRLLLSAAEKDRKQFFVGADISYTCCLMAIINLCLNSLNGEVLHMNTISNVCWHRWCIIVDSFTKIPTVYEVEFNNGEPAPATVEDLKPLPVEGIIQPVKSVPAQNIQFIRFSAKA
jgi:hypothetical protein|nr:MAG TPA: type I restriction-modification system methyltransferase [Caudoviricetes sp.]